MQTVEVWLIDKHDHTAIPRGPTSRAGDFTEFVPKSDYDEAMTRIFKLEQAIVEQQRQLYRGTTIPAGAGGAHP